MGKKDPRIDAYIARSAPFAQPILKRLRKIVHEGCPEVEETMKWQFPHFDYKGIMCGMAAFKGHCTFGFWKASLIFGKRGKRAREEEGMGQFGRITSLSNLPDDRTLVRYVKKARDLNDAGVKVPERVNGKARPLPRMPADLKAALARNAKARKTFEGFSPTNKREYIEWVATAKRDATRQNRLKTAVQWMSEGKTHNWRYVK